MSCDMSCYEAKIQSCSDIVLRAGFPPNLPLYWILQKVGSGNTYAKLSSSDNNGDLIILEDELPAGLLTEGSDFKIQVRSGSNYNQPVIMAFDAVEYTCILLSLSKLIMIGDADVPGNIIQGADATIPPGPGTGYLIPITQADFTTATDYPNAALNGKALAIFWDDVPRFLTASEWQHTSTGIQILVDGFDATANNYSFHIYIIGNEV